MSKTGTKKKSASIGDEIQCEKGFVDLKLEPGEDLNQTKIVDLKLEPDEDHKSIADLKLADGERRKRGGAGGA
ncbi:hypothetical protein U1Q18_020120 [Sarracenia purpurea var. burkii]